MKHRNRMEKLLELFTPQPGFKILDITSHADGVSVMLAQRLVALGGRFSLVRYPGEHLLMPLHEGVEIDEQTVVDYHRPFRALPRDNDIVFLRDVLHRHAMPERIMRAIYTTLANAAEVVIITEAKFADPDAQLAMLEKADFRAGNNIEGIIEGSTVVMGKKMHMWGNGL